MPVIESQHPRQWIAADHVSVSELTVMLRMGYKDVLRTLVRDDVTVYRFPFGRTCCHYVSQDTAERLRLKYGNKVARAQRQARIPAKPKGEPLALRCPRCGREGKQWRHGRSTTGMLRVMCGHCKADYTMGSRPPLQSTCPHCGATRHQRRQNPNAAGNLRVLCAECGGRYVLDGNPDARPEQSPIVWPPQAARLEDW